MTYDRGDGIDIDKRIGTGRFFTNRKILKKWRSNNTLLKNLPVTYRD